MAELGLQAFPGGDEVFLGTEERNLFGRGNGAQEVFVPVVQGVVRAATKDSMDSLDDVQEYSMEGTSVFVQRSKKTSSKKRRSMSTVLRMSQCAKSKIPQMDRLGPVLLVHTDFHGQWNARKRLLQLLFENPEGDTLSVNWFESLKFRDRRSGGTTTKNEVALRFESVAEHRRQKPRVARSIGGLRESASRSLDEISGTTECFVFG